MPTQKFEGKEKEREKKSKKINKRKLLWWHGDIQYAEPIVAVVIILANCPFPKRQPPPVKSLLWEHDVQGNWNNTLASKTIGIDYH